MNLTEELKLIAEHTEIDVLGFTDASPFAGYAWKESKRIDPRLTMPEAQSIIVAGIYIGGMILPDWESPQLGRTSRLYISSYFSDVISPLQPLQEHLTSRGYRAVTCDSIDGESSSIPLKLAAVRAGLGWQGRHTLLITRKYGTFLALGGIITDAVLDYPAKVEKNRCGACSRCREACPLGALDTEFQLDWQRCLSYQLQTEALTEEAVSVMGNRIGDCEICQEACPWNQGHLKKPLETPMTKRFGKQRDALREFFDIRNLAGLTEQEYASRLGYLRTDIPYATFMRNVGLVLKQQGSREG